jgi:hypothetical protein
MLTLLGTAHPIRYNRNNNTLYCLGFCQALLALTFAALNSSPSYGQAMTIAPSIDPRITLNSITSNSKLAADRHLQTLEYPRTAMLFENHAPKPIMAIVFRWAYVDRNGVSRVTFSHFDGYLFPPTRVVLNANDEAIVSELGICQSKDYSTLLNAPNRLGSPLGSEDFSAIFGTGPVTVSLDLAVFSDGEITGPDLSHYEQDIATRHRAMLALVDQIGDQSDGSVIEDRVNTLMSAQRTPGDAVGDVQLKLARTLLRSPNRAGTLASFKSHSIPSTFYRAAGKAANEQ